MKTKRYLTNTKTRRSIVRKSYKSGKKQKKILILLSTTTVIHTVIGLLKMPRTLAAKGVRASEISRAVAASTRVTTSAAVITALNQKINTYTKATPKTRPAAELAMMKALNSILRNYQTAAENEPENALDIFASGTFGTKGYGGRTQQEFKVKNTSVTRTVSLVAKGSGSHTCHVWKYSLDGENWNWIMPTIAAKATIEDLPEGQYVYFTHELVTTKGPQGVSQVFKLMIA